MVVMLIDYSLESKTGYFEIESLDVKNLPQEQ